MAVEVISLGCRLNGVEADSMRRLAASAGLRDAVVVNTCAVTGEAVRQSAQALRRAARRDTAARIVATGCAVQIEPARFAAMPEVAAVLGNAGKMHPESWFRLAAGQSGGAVGPLAGGSPLPGARGDVRVRAFLQIQTGCDHRCTFCTIPFGRGPSRSVLPDEVVRLARELVEEGAREVVLTGVDLTAFGADLGRGSGDGPSLGRLVRRILRQIPDLPRLRLSSVDSVEVDRELVEAFATEPRLMPHLHLSLQSGDDLVLKRMKRRHGRRDVMDLCQELRRLRPGIVFGADLIAGFPTETEAMFARSLDLVAECGLVQVHAFPYSARPGTPAARMPPVAPEVVRERAARLRAAGAAALARRLAAEVGRGQRVLTESHDAGRTEGFLPVRFAAPVGRGALLDVAAVSQDGQALLVG